MTLDQKSSGSSPDRATKKPRLRFFLLRRKGEKFTPTFRATRGIVGVYPDIVSETNNRREALPAP